VLKQVVQVVHPHQTPCAGMDLPLHNPQKMRLCRLCRLCTPAPARKMSAASWNCGQPQSLQIGLMTRLQSCGSRLKRVRAAAPPLLALRFRRRLDALLLMQVRHSRVSPNTRQSPPLLGFAVSAAAH